MRVFAIRTIEFHEAELRAIAQRTPDAMREGAMLTAYHTRAIQIIKDGMRDRKVGLYFGNRRVNAELRSGRFGQFWYLAASEDDLRKAAGKSIIPFQKGSKRSRTLKTLGLTQDVRLEPVEPYLERLNTPSVAAFYFKAKMISGAPGAQNGETND